MPPPAHLAPRPISSFLCRSPCRRAFGRVAPPPTVAGRPPIPCQCGQGWSRAGACGQGLCAGNSRAEWEAARQPWNPTQRDPAPSRQGRLVPGTRWEPVRSGFVGGNGPTPFFQCLKIPFLKHGRHMRFPGKNPIAGTRVEPNAQPVRVPNPRTITVMTVRSRSLSPRTITVRSRSRTITVPPAVPAVQTARGHAAVAQRARPARAMRLAAAGAAAAGSCDRCRRGFFARARLSSRPGQALAQNRAQAGREPEETHRPAVPAAAAGPRGSRAAAAGADLGPSCG